MSEIVPTTRFGWSPSEKVELKARLLSELKKTGKPYIAIAACGLTKSTVAHWRKQDEEFRKAWLAVFAANQFVRSPRQFGEKRSQEAYRRFLAVVCRGWTLSRAAAEIGISTETARKWRHQNPDVEIVDEEGVPVLNSDGSVATVKFADAWHEALEQGTDRLEDEAYRRAVEGSPRAVFYQGEKCGEQLEYSDTLMVVMLKARRPHKFQERRDERGDTGRATSPPVDLRAIDFSTLSTDALAIVYRTAVGEAEGDPIKSNGAAH